MELLSLVIRVLIASIIMILTLPFKFVADLGKKLISVILYDFELDDDDLF